VSISSAPQAIAFACLRVAPRADAAGVRAHLGTGLAALILTLLLRLLARTDAAWDLPPDHQDDSVPAPHALIMPTMGRAPPAAAIEAGLVPDWILTGIRNHGMRPAAARQLRRPRPRPARAPPVLTPA